MKKLFKAIQIARVSHQGNEQKDIRLTQIKSISSVLQCLSKCERNLLKIQSYLQTQITPIDRRPKLHLWLCDTMWWSVKERRKYRYEHHL